MKIACHKTIEDKILASRVFQNGLLLFLDLYPNPKLFVWLVDFS
jgi:hypothetical protein